MPRKRKEYEKEKKVQEVITFNFTDYKKDKVGFLKAGNFNKKILRIIRLHNRTIYPLRVVYDAGEGQERCKNFNLNGAAKDSEARIYNKLPEDFS